MKKEDESSQASKKILLKNGLEVNFDIIIYNIFLIITLLLYLSAIGIWGYQIIYWLWSASWPEITIAGFFELRPYKSTWLGVDKIVNYFLAQNLGIGCIAAGFLFGIIFDKKNFEP